MAQVFSRNTIKFLKDIEHYNNRQWYADNKPLYQEHVLEPCKHLVSELSGAVTDIDPYIETTPAIGKTISRIHRDTRFSHDKRPYRGNVWIIFRRRARGLFHTPGFFFEIYPDYFHYGMGFYQPAARYMECYRAAISENEKAFIKIVTRMAQDGVFSLQGDVYKRNRYPGKQAGLAQWYNRKNLFMVAREDDINRVYDFAGLAELLQKGFTSLAGLYHFLLNVYNQASPDDAW